MGMRGKKIRQPSLNRKLLGRWAPLVVEGMTVATRAPDQQIASPSILEISRAAGSKIISDRLGEREEHLVEGERLLLTQRWLEDTAGTTCVSWEAEATAANQLQPPLSASTCSAPPVVMRLKTIRYLSEYLMIHCD